MGFEARLPICTLPLSHGRKSAQSLIKEQITKGSMRGVELPSNTTQLIVVQYVDDTPVLVEGQEDVVRTMVGILNTVSLATWLKLNWNRYFA